MQQVFYRDLRLGILGGGQLGRMLIQAAIDYNVHIRVLDPGADAPCRPYAHTFVQGSLRDYDTVMAFGQDCDVITIEIEHVNTEALADLQAIGKRVFPDPAVIRMIQDKRLQKQFYEAHGLPTAAFTLTDDRAAVMALRDRLPLVHKLGREGYDGRGVQVLRTTQDLSTTFDAPGLVEELVPFVKEVAILAARNPAGQTAVFDPVEMIFHPEANLVEYLFAPANLTPALADNARALALRLLEALEYVGIMAVEMFLTPDGTWLINEAAPRPHNSGHHTIRACDTSQYEQHLRAILGLPLGSTRQHTPAAMVNILGAPGQTGPAAYAYLSEALEMEGVYPHLYGKTETKPFRKMGHVTLLDPDPLQLRAKALWIKDRLQAIVAS